MNDDDPWVQTLALRLRAHYGAAAPSAAEAELAAELARRLGALSTARGTPRYRSIRSLATGGMGSVALAFDEALGRPVALKLASAGANAADTARRRLRLLHEAAITGRLQHPGIVPIHDLGTDAAGEPYFAMQHIDGRSLHDLLVEVRAGGSRDRGLLRIVEVLLRVCDTMAYAHARGVVHRDLKPSNVMVGAFGEVYVVDWGLARATGDPADDAAVQARTATATDLQLTASGTVLGTPSYLPPERAVEGAGEAAAPSPAADVYGLGAILYELLAGAPPYARERAEWTLAEILATIRERPPRPVRELAPAADPELAAICARAMHRDPAQRYAGMRALADDLRAFAEHRIVRAHGGGAATMLRKWIRRNRALAATVAASVLVLASASAWFVASLAHARDAAAANLRDVLDLAVVERIADLRRRADELWPLDVAREAAIAAWLQSADELRPIGDRLRARRAALGPAVPLEAEAAAEQHWQRRLLDDAIGALDAFFAAPPPEPTLSLESTFAAVAARPAAARRLAARCLDDADAARRWREAADHVRANPVYRGLALRPQPGLLPLGDDPTSGLAEFAHLQSGAVPTRDDAGQLRCDDATGIVLVLLPGGTFWMGAGPDDAHNRDPMAETINELPVREVRLAPFFAAKHELTQAQWQRATGTNPSVHTAVSIYVAAGTAGRHPVESIDWWDARATLHKLGLQLPTEAQWEFAARAGTHTPWHCGAALADLLSPPRGNLADARSAVALGAQGWAPTPGLDDGYVMHAPVGSFPANAFGLFDVLGNVAEWCDDEYRSYATDPAPDTAARPRSAAPTTVMYRGGAFDEPAQEARSANRAGGPPDRRHVSLGVRAVRALAQ